MAKSKGFEHSPNSGIERWLIAMVVLESGEIELPVGLFDFSFELFD